MSTNDSKDRHVCDRQADQLITLVAICSGIITREIEDDDLLNIIGDFFQSLGTNISLAASTRSKCRD